MSLSEKKNREAPSGEPSTFQKVKAGGEAERAGTWKRSCSAGGRASYDTLLLGNQTRGGPQQAGDPCAGSERSSGRARGGSLPDALKMLLKHLPLQLAEGKKETLKQNKQQGINTLCFPPTG